MKIARRSFLAGAAASGIITPSRAWIHGRHVDTYIVPIIGDSNTGSGESFDAALDTVSTGIIQLKHDFTTANAQEPLDESSMSALRIGPVTKLAQLLQTNGVIPSYVQRVVLVPCGWAGTGLNAAANNYWNITSGGLGGRFALDGGGGLTNGYYAMVNKAKALFPNNRIWFHVVIIGTNDGSTTQANERLWLQQLVGEIRGVYSDASAPFLFCGIPPDVTNVLLRNQLNISNVVTVLQGIGSDITNSYYIDPSGVPSYFDNQWVHFSAVGHRGGTDNSTTSGNNTNGTPFVWSAAAAYQLIAAGSPKNTVLASDGFLYSCIADNTNKDPAGNTQTAFWTQVRQYAQTIAVPNSLAGKMYTTLAAIL